MGSLIVFFIEQAIELGPSNISGAAARSLERLVTR
jgi:hypothetical protein